MQRTRGAMVPFVSTPSFTGPVGDAICGADLSLFVGLPIVGVLSYVLARSIDVEAESRLAAEEERELEAAAASHASPAAAMG
jgi:hypothetical protein